MLTMRQCTGAADFIPWYSGSAVRRAKEKGAIIIAPNYCLGPEGNYQDIYSSIKDFLAWYDKEGCFEPGCEKWTDWVYKQESTQNFTIDKKHVYVEGESAGGHAAVTAMWLNAAKDGPHLPIDVALLRYPMIAHYSRSWPEKTKENPGGLVLYMAEGYKPSFVADSAKDVAAIIVELEKWGVVPTCTARPPPRGMALAVRLSITQTWKQYFQRLHGEELGGPVDPQDETLMDGVERAENCADRVIPQFLPPIHIYHGHDDTNCKPGDTEKFVKALRNPQLYGQRFEGDDMLFFQEVYELKTKRVWDNKNKVLKIERSGAVGHGFDYYLQEKDEKFLRNAYERVAKLWAPGS
jgi:acetyl esterase/lipase